MILWTVQAAGAVEAFERLGELRGRWPTAIDPGWLAAYQWMSRQMSARGLGTGCLPPVWAWHSCRGSGQPPDQETLLALLSDADWEHGQRILEFNAPDELCLLSVYSWWNVLLDRFTRTPEYVLPADDPIARKIFATADARLDQSEHADDVQATLEFLKWDWVKDVRKVRP
jgi:hypothetical protein